VSLISCKSLFVLFRLIVDKSPIKQRDEDSGMWKPKKKFKCFNRYTEPSHVNIVISAM